MKDRLNQLKAGLSALFAAAQPRQAEAPGGLPERLSAVGAMEILPLPDPAPGMAWVEDGVQKAEEKLTDYERRREALLVPLACEWAEKYLALADLSARINDAFDELEAINAPRNTARRGAGKLGSLTLHTLARDFAIARKRADTVRYEEDLMLRAKDLVDACVGRWAEGGRDEIRQMAEIAFTKNAKGEYSRSGMVRLRRLQSDDPEWQEAMGIIREAEIVDGVASYLLVSVRDRHGKYRPLPLDIAGIRPYRLRQGA